MEEHIKIETTQNVAIQYELASVGDRIFAYLIDVLVLSAYFFLMAIILSTLEIASVAIFIILFFLPLVFYDLLSEIFMNGQSIGKRARKIKVVRQDGSQASLGNYLLRWLFRAIDITLFSGAVAVIFILWRGTGQRLGDLAAGTAVIKLKTKASLDDTILTEVAQDYQVQIPGVEKLSDSDIALVKEVLQTMATLSDRLKRQELIRKLQAKLEKKMGIQSDLQPQVFLETVLKDYNHIKGVL